MLCLFVVCMVDAGVVFRFNTVIYHRNEFTTIYENDGYSIICDASRSRGYMQVAHTLEESIRNIYNEFNSRNDEPKAHFRGPERDEAGVLTYYGRDSMPVKPQDVWRLASNAIRHVDANINPEEERFRVLFRSLAILDVQSDGSETGMKGSFVYDENQKVFSALMSDDFAIEALNDMPRNNYTKKYNIRSVEFSSDIEYFYRHIYDKNGKMALANEKRYFGLWESPYDVKGHVCPELHAFLSGMGATRELIRVRDAGEI